MSDIDRATHRTDAILSRLERNLTRIYRDTTDDILDEIDLDRLYLDEGSPMQRQRHAERNGLGKAVAVVAAGLVLANTKAIARINGTMRRVYSTNYDYMSSHIKRQTGANLGGSSAPDPSRHTRRYYNRAQGKQYVSAEIMRELKQGIRNGEGVPKLTQRIMRASNRNCSNATRVARTEATRYMNTARMDSFDEARKLGIELDKMWIATHDSRVRHSHAMLDGEAVPLDDEFSNGLEYPGDPEGEPEEVVNCRCTVTAVIRS